MIRMSAEVTGDWDEAFQRLNKMRNDREQLFRIAEEIAEIVAGKVREYIKTQAIDLTPISKSPSNDQDPRILIESGTYVNSIDVQSVEEMGNFIECTVSVGSGMTADGEMSLQQLAFKLEYGEGRIPGNMPFHKSWEMMRGEINSMARERILAILKEDVS